MSTWMQIFISLVLMIFGSFMDGLSERAINVGWVPWHLFNWARRDLIILFIYLNLGWRFITHEKIFLLDAVTEINSPRQFWRRLLFALGAFCFAVVLNDFMHHLFYELGIAARPYMDWGHDKPGWLP